MPLNVSHEKYDKKFIYAHYQRMALTVPIFHGTHNRPVTFFDIRCIDSYRKQQKSIEKQVKFIPDFEFSPYAKCRMLSSAWYPSVCGLNANV
jgi:hypothetical protein